MSLKFVKHRESCYLRKNKIDCQVGILAHENLKPSPKVLEAVMAFAASYDIDFVPTKTGE